METFTRGLQYQKTITMVTEICCSCGVAFGIPSDLQDHLRNDPDKWFFCPNGHRQHYSESAVQKQLRETKQRLENANNRIAQQSAENIQLESQLEKEKKKLKRLQKGTCTCCKRTFTNLKRHMETQHPEQLKK